MTIEEIINEFNRFWNKSINLILKLTKEKEKEAIYKLLENKKYDNILNF